jgi:outer membrane protein assembly factor BamD
MLISSIRWRPLAAIALAAGFACAFSPIAFGQKPKITKVKPQPKKSDEPSVEPDKVLYDRAMKDIKRKSYIEARLNLQTLVNTYPDSEYLAKAKLAVADSYYNEGGTSNMTQAVDEYKNFIVFFPFLDEAAYAQMQVAMAHYRMMEKADRDNSQAEAAESEFQVFLQKYPDSKLRPSAEQSLRNVQEVLADGEFRIGRFYYVRARTNPADYSAAAARLVEVSQRYPLYSQTDEALWMLGDVYERVKKFSKNEDDKNHWGDLAAKCYARIVTDYPLSKLAPAAKARLQGMGVAVPAADAEATARMEKDRAYEKQHHPNTLLNPVSAFKEGPDVYAAARVGQPNLTPPDDAVSATDVLKQGAAGPSFGIDAQRATAPDDSSNNAPANIIEGPAVDSSAGGPVGATAAVQILEAPSGPVDAGADSSSSSSPQPSSSSPSSSSSDPATAVLSTSPSAVATADPGPSAAPASAPAEQTIQETAPATQPAPAAATSSSSSAAKTAPASDSQKESTSKKKKGLHKIIPF